MRFFKSALQKLKRTASDRKTRRVTAIVLGCLAISLVFARPAKALLGIGIDDVAGWISYGEFILMSALGKLTLVGFELIKQVASYNDFINASAVAKGWFIIRDVANMFFILILLVIAFGTLFGIEKYNYNEWLRKVVIMAVLINFSKLITGFFIDLMQVIMMTFVNAFADTAAGNLTTAVGLKNFLALDPAKSGEEVSQLSIAGTLLIGLIMITVLCIVTFTYVLMFLVRIVALWVLTVLSPLAYLLAAFPDTEEYAKRWWKEFWKYLTIGPVLAFFLWLTLTITHGGNTSRLITNGTASGMGGTSQAQFESGGAVSAGISAVSTSDGILSFLIAIVLLMISLSIASESGVALGSAAAEGVRKMLIQQFLHAATNPLRWGWTQKLARGVTGELGAGIWMPFGRRIPIPILSHRMVKANAWLEQKRLADKTAAEEQMKVLRYRPLIRRFANPLTGRSTIFGSKRLADFSKKWLRREATKWRQEAMVEQFNPGESTDKKYIEEFFTEHAGNYNQLNVKRRKALAAAVKKYGIDITRSAPRFAAQIANSGMDFDQELWGFKGEYEDEEGNKQRYSWKFDNRRRVWFQLGRDPRTREVKRMVEIPEDEFEFGKNFPGADGKNYPGPVISKTATWPKGKFGKLGEAFGMMGSYMQGVGLAPYHATQQALYDRFGGDADKFFGSEEFQAGLHSGEYLPREQYEDAVQQELELQADTEAGRLHLGELEVSDDAIEQGLRGGAVTLYDDIEDSQYEAMGFKPSDAGRHIEDEAGKKRFAEIAREKFIDAQQRQRARDLEENRMLLTQVEDTLGAGEVAGLDYKTLTQEKRNELWRKLSPEASLELHDALQDSDALVTATLENEVKTDAAYQKKLATDADRLYTSLVTSSGIDLVNQRRVGVTRQHVERHERAHAAIDGWSAQQVESFFGNLDASRQQEMLKEYERRWGKITTPSHALSAKREILTDMIAANEGGRKSSTFALHRAEHGDTYHATRRAIRQYGGGNIDAFYASDYYKRNADKFVSKQAYAENQKYRTTHKAIRHQFGGDAKKFFKSEEFRSNPAKHMSNLEYHRERHEAQLADQLEEAVDTGRIGKALREVRSIPRDLRHKIWEQIPEAHRKAAAEEIRLSVNKHSNDEEVVTEALSRMLAAHREGGNRTGYLTLKTPGEQEIAITLHAAARKIMPKHSLTASSTVPSAFGPKVPPLRTAPAGTGRITAPRPHAAGSVGTSAPGVVVNTSEVSNAIRDALRGIGDLAGENVPSRQDMEQGFKTVLRSVEVLAKTNRGMRDALQPIRRQMRVLRESLATARNDDEIRTVAHQLQALKATYLDRPNYQTVSQRAVSPAEDLSDDAFTT